jgi:hypothetical protein
MANCSIPNSIPATGRISTPSSRRLKKGNNACASFREAFSRAKAIGSWALRSFNAQRSTPNAQRSIQRVGRWKLDVERWTFSSSGRVKGAWWPSRSSKPSSPRKWRGRFDSYPLRQFFQIVILSGAQRSRRIPWRYREIIHRDSSTSLGMTSALERG